MVYTKYQFRMQRLRQLTDFISKVYFLARPYGRRKLLFVFSLILAQGMFQVIGVTSIFPFLALASDPSGFRNSSLGEKILGYLPPLTDSQLLLAAGIFALVMLLFSNVLMLAGDVFRTRYAYGFAHWLRMRLLGRIIRNPYGYFLQQNTAELLKKTTIDVNQYVNSVLAPLLEAIARLVTVAFLILTLVLINPVFAIAVALCLGLFYTAVFYFLKNRREVISNALKVAFRGAMREAQQLLAGIKPIKVHGVEKSFLNRFARHSMIMASLRKWFPIFQNSPRYFIEPVAFGAIVVFVLLLAMKGQSFTEYIPALGVMALAGYRLIPNFQLLYGAATGITLMIYSLDEVYEEFIQAENADLTEALQEGIMGAEKLEWSNSITLDNIVFQYPSSPGPTINGLSLTIEKFQFLAFIGETGSGKSTIVDIMLGLHRPQSGQILVDGKPLTPDKRRNWRAGIGYVPQDIFLLDDTITANIAFGVNPDKVDQGQVTAVAKAAQIHEFIESELIDGYNTTVGERGVRLSGGQRQRIGLARALYHQPELLILDEATSALDNATESALMKAIESLYGRVTLVVIAHRLTTIRNADRICQLENGAIARIGTYHELDLEEAELK